MSVGSKTERKLHQVAISGAVLASAWSHGGAAGCTLCLSCLSHIPAALSLHLESLKCLKTHFPWGSRWPMAEECGGVTVQLTRFRSWAETEPAPWSCPVGPGCSEDGAGDGSWLSFLPFCLPPMCSRSGLPWERFLSEPWTQTSPQSLFLQNLRPPG